MVPPIDVSDINSIDDAKKAIKTWEISQEKAGFIAQALLEVKKEKPSKSKTKTTTIDTLLEKYIDTPATAKEYEDAVKVFAQGENTIEKKDLNLLVKVYLKAYQSSDLWRLKGILIRFYRNKQAKDIEKNIEQFRSLILQDVNRLQWDLNKQLEEMITSWAIVIPQNIANHEERREIIKDIENKIKGISNLRVWVRDERSIDNIYTKLKKQYQSEIISFKLPPSFARWK